MTSFGNHHLHNYQHARPNSVCGTASTSGQRRGLGLNSLTNTINKLAQDEDRNKKLLELLSAKVKLLGHTYTDHTSKSFSESGFTFTQTLGQGRFGSVKLAKQKDNEHVAFGNEQVPGSKAGQIQMKSGRGNRIHSAFVAVRTIPRYTVRNARLAENDLLSSKESHATLMKQIKALRKLDHPHICREFETFEDAQCIYIVMEYLHGGSLFERALCGVNPISEASCMHYIRQITSAVAHAHDNNIVHQDLRPQNCLFASADDDARLVVIDWCYAEFIDSPASEARNYAPVGNFTCPEFNVMHRTDRGDIWSIGVMAFAMLTYRLPFDDGEVDFNGPVQWEQDDLKSVSPECIKLVNSMLQKNPNARPSARELLANPLLSKTWHTPHSVDQEEIDIAKAMVNFSHKSRLQRQAATFAAAHLSGPELQKLSKLFDEMDRNGDGNIDKVELETEFEKLSMSESSSSPTSKAQIKDKKESVKFLIQALDTDGSGQISYSEFLSAAADSHMQNHVELVYEAFRGFDLDASGLISRAEIDSLMSSPEIEQLLEALKNTGNEEVAKQAMQIDTDGCLTSKELLQKLDKDGNENVSFDEFIVAILGAPDGGAADPSEHPMAKRASLRAQNWNQNHQKHAQPVSTRYQPGSFQPGRHLQQQVGGQRPQSSLY